MIGRIMSDWQPIDTAPKDGRQILVWDRADRETDKLYWMQDHWNNILGHAVDADALTHWMPLPNPPVRGNEREP